MWTSYLILKHSWYILLMNPNRNTGSTNHHDRYKSFNNVALIYFYNLIICKVYFEKINGTTIFIHIAMISGSVTTIYLQIL